MSGCFVLKHGVCLVSATHYTVQLLATESVHGSPGGVKPGILENCWTCSEMQNRKIQNSVLSLPKSVLKSLDFAVTRFLMKLFRTSNTEVIAECQRYFAFSP